MGEREPGWAVGLALGLLAVALRSHLRPGQVPKPTSDVLDLATGSARELRGVPGMGERRALALVEARWRHAPGDPPLVLGDVRGIGPASRAAVAEWLAERGAGPVP